MLTLSKEHLRFSISQKLCAPINISLIQIGQAGYTFLQVLQVREAEG